MILHSLKFSLYNSPVVHSTFVISTTTTGVQIPFPFANSDFKNLLIGRSATTFSFLQSFTGSPIIFLVPNYLLRPHMAWGKVSEI